MKRTLYKLLQISNDIDAIKRGTYKQRIARRTLGRISGRIINQIVRKMFK